MSLLTSIPDQKNIKKKKKQNQSKPKKQNQPSSWNQIKNLLTCKQTQVSTQFTSPNQINTKLINNNGKYSKMGFSCSSVCNFKDVVHHGNTRVVHPSDHNSSESIGSSVNRKRTTNRSFSRSTRCNSMTSSSITMPFTKFSGCYECHMIVDPTRYPSPRNTICVCSQCGEVFPNTQSLELHQAVRHAVSELGPEDSGRRIVEIIFKSSWFTKHDPIFKIQRILKVRNTTRTIQRFEECRDAVKRRAQNSNRKNPRCAADGNELLRFYCATLSCSLGAEGASSLCGAVGPTTCGACAIVRHGFQGNNVVVAGGDKWKGSVMTTASSGRAHDSMKLCKNDKGVRAMIVCRVIAGRVKRIEKDPTVEDDCGSYDSAGGYVGMYTNIEELFVFNPKAILPCFLVIYETIE